MRLLGSCLLLVQVGTWGPGDYVTVLQSDKQPSLIRPDAAALSGPVTKKLAQRQLAESASASTKERSAFELFKGFASEAEHKHWTAPPPPPSPSKFSLPRNLEISWSDMGLIGVAHKN